MPTLTGTTGDDEIPGTEGDDVISGLAGNDYINGRGGNDRLDGGTGVDTLVGGTGDDYLIAQDFGDRVDGGDGFDTLDVSPYYVPNFVYPRQSIDYSWEYNSQTDAIEFISTVKDYFFGNLVSTTINLLVQGLSIERVIGFNPGSDQTGPLKVETWNFGSMTRSIEIFGGTGTDIIVSGSASDIIHGGFGNDTITLGRGDSVFGDDGIDAFLANSSSDLTGTTVSGGTGADTLQISINARMSDITSANGQLSWGALRLTGVENIGITGSGGYAANETIAFSVTGTDEANIITFGPGSAHTTNVQIFGGAGDDVINSGGTNDVLNGGVGNDRISGNGQLFGGDGDDQLDGTGRLDGGAGADLIIGTGQLFGGDGNDTFRPGAATAVDGGAGFDTLDFSQQSTGLTFSLASATNVTGIEGVIGTTRADDITGDGGGNFLIGLGNADTLRGGAGDDTLFGDDTVATASDGADQLFGDDGNDTLFGGGGQDLLSGGADNDTVFGDAGNDQIDGGSGDDTLQGDAGDDQITGGAGSDTVVYTQARNIVDITYSNGQITVTGPAGRDVLTGIERLQFADGVFDVRADGQLATQARRVMTGTVNPEILNGGDSGDTLDGGAGNDTLVGGLGDDVLTGGLGTDAAVFNYARSGATLTYENGAIVVTGAEGRDVLTGIEALQFSDGYYEVVNGVLSATPRANLSSGTAGADVFASRPGGETIDGGAGFDVVTYGSVVRQYAARGGTTSTITGGPEGGVDALVSIEEARFVDGVLSFDVNGVPAQVMRLYDTALDRLPDQPGLEAQIRAIQTGATTLQALANAFVASPEFTARYGNLSNQQFVEQLYRFALDREGDAPGIAAQVNALNTGTSRGALLIAFSESPEHRTLTQPTLNAGLWVPDAEALQIARLYDATFDRLPDAPGLAGQVAALDAGVSLLTIAGAFAASAEFQSRYGALTNQQFVEQLYRFCLNREGDAPGVAAQVNALNSGVSRAQILLNLSESAEHVALTAPLWSGGVRTLDTVVDRLTSPLEIHDAKSDGPQVSPLVEHDGFVPTDIDHAPVPAADIGTDDLHGLAHGLPSLNPFEADIALVSDHWARPFDDSAQHPGHHTDWLVA